MTDRVKNILIGLFVTGALAVLIAFVLFLKPTIGDGKKMLSVRFTNIAGISVGTRVTFAGKPVGEVIHIRELSKARDHADEQGRIYLYQLTLKIDSSVDVYSSDEISIKTTGLMGRFLRLAQTGKVQGYALGLLMGLVILIYWSVR